MDPAKFPGSGPDPDPIFTPDPAPSLFNSILEWI